MRRRDAAEGGPKDRLFEDGLAFLHPLVQVLVGRLLTRKKRQCSRIPVQSCRSVTTIVVLGRHLWCRRTACSESNSIGLGKCYQMKVGQREPRGAAQRRPPCGCRRVLLLAEILNIRSKVPTNLQEVKTSHKPHLKWQCLIDMWQSSLMAINTQRRA